MVILIGVAATVLFMLNVVLKALFRRERVGFFDWTLAILSTGAMVMAVTINQLDSAADASWVQIAQVVGGALALLGIGIMIVDALRKHPVFASRGFLSLGVGALIALASFSVPLTATTLAYPTATPIQVAQLPAAATGAPTTMRAQPTRVLPTATLPQPTASQPPTFTPQPTATLLTLATRTPTVTPTEVAPCLATTDFNLRLRALPNTDAETLVVIPFGTGIPVTARNADATWWYVSYGGQEGWVDGQFLTRSSNCEALPVRQN